MSNSPANNFFSDGSPYLTHPLLSDERTAAEVDQLESLVGSVSGRILDIGCGFGRHSIELAARRADVTGIDSSPAMIKAARQRATEAGQFVDFQCVAAADLSDVARYDLALCLFTTFGQLDRVSGDDEPHLELLRRTRRALRPGATLVVEVPDRDRAAAALVEDELLGSTHVTRCFDPVTGTIGERFELESGEVFNLAYRVFTKTELVDLLHDGGFDVQRVLDRALVEPPLNFITVIAQRPA